MSHVKHVLGWRTLRLPFVLASGVAVAGGVLITATLVLLGAGPAWGDARAQASTPSAGAPHQRADRAADPGPRMAPAEVGGGGVTTVPPQLRTNSQANPGTPPVGTSADPPTGTARPTASPTAPDPVTPDATAPKPRAATVDPTSSPHPSPSPTGPASPQARPAAAPLPARTERPPAVGGYAPDRVPAVGSRPSVASSASTTPQAATNVAAGWASYLPGQEFGVKIFVAGLVALVISIGGLVTLAIRRRQ